MKDVKRMFGAIAAKKPAKAHTPKVLDQKVLCKKTKSEQTHLVLGMAGLSKRDKDAMAQTLLVSVLGGGMSSRLYHRLREEMGVCYYVYASANTYAHYGNISIHAGIPAGKLHEVIGVVKEELARLTSEEIPAEELIIAKNYLIGSLVTGLETSNAFANYYGLQELAGLPLVTPEQKIKLVRKITSAELTRLAKKLFTKDALRLSVVGPVKGEEKLEALLQ